MSHAALRADRSDIDLLKDAAPVVTVTVLHHHLLIDAYGDIASRYLVAQLIRAARLLFFSLTGRKRAKLLPYARQLAHAFLAHQEAWRQFSNSIHVPPDFAYLLFPGTDDTLPAIERIAHRLAAEHKPAETPSIQDPLAQPIPAADLAAQWQQEYDSVTLSGPGPVGSTPYPTDYPDDPPTSPDADHADEPYDPAST